MRRLTVFNLVTLDGYFAGQGGDISWHMVDEEFQELITLALANNRDLRTAALNVERVQALYQIQRSELFPTIAAFGTATDQRVPDSILVPGQSKTFHQYSVGLGFSAYELDLFGRVRSLKKQALEQFFATEEARRSLQISLMAEVAGTYLTLAADRERLKLAQETRYPWDGAVAHWRSLPTDDPGIFVDIDTPQDLI